MLYNIYAGMGGSFGGAQYMGTVDCEAGEAYEMARQFAIEEYESYAGYHGIVDIGEIWDDLERFGLEEGCSEDDVEEVYTDEVESWIEYWVVSLEEDSEFVEAEMEVEYL